MVSTAPGTGPIESARWLVQLSPAVTGFGHEPQVETGEHEERARGWR